MKLTMGQIMRTKAEAIRVTALHSSPKPYNPRKSAVVARVEDALNSSEQITEELREDMGKILSALIGEPIEVERELGGFPKFGVVVATKNENDHSYPSNVPLILNRGRYAITPSGDEGNNLSWDRSGLRWATPQEIEELFTAFALRVRGGQDFDRDFPLV